MITMDLVFEKTGVGSVPGAGGVLPRFVRAVAVLSVSLYGACVVGAFLAIRLAASLYRGAD